MAPPPKPKGKRLSSPFTTPSNNACSLEKLLESVLAMSDPSVPLDLSLERILESRVLESDKEKLINVALRVGSALLDAASRSARNLATAHNSVVWPLPPELTMKVLSCLDTTSLCYASATCTAFSKCASDPSFYANIDLTRNWREVGDFVVFTMIHRAEKNLRSLKLGADSRFDSEGNRNEPPLTKSCLFALILDNGALGALLQKLCLSHIHCMEKHGLILALSNCKSLKDLEIVGLNVGLGGILTTVSTYCPSIERLCLDYSNFSRPPLVLVSDNLMNKFKNLSSISLRGFIFFDSVLHVLIKGSAKLRYADFSYSIDLKGFFLKGVGNGNGGDNLETLILRDCPFLTRDAIGPFLNDVIDGKWKSLRFLDVTSDRREFMSDAKILEIFKENRPEIRLLADREIMQSGENQNLNSSTDDEIRQKEDDQNLDSSISGTGTDAGSSSGDEVSQNGDDDDQNLDDSSSSDDYIAHTQNGDDHDEIARNGEDQNLDSSSDDEVH